MKKLLLKTMFLLCALVAGSTSVWADDVTFDATKDVTATEASYQSTVKTFTATDGSKWNAIGYGTTANTNIVIGKGGANYLETPEVNGDISSVTVTWSGNTNYYLALQTTSGTELEAKKNPGTSEASTATFNISEGSYRQLRLVGRRSSGTSNAAATITKVVVTYTVSSVATTTTTIDVSGLTNTNIAKGTSAGYLSASVTSSGSPVDGATVTWSSSEESVATISSSGVVTLVGEGSTTITASYAGVENTYAVSSDTYVINVVNDSHIYVEAALADLTSTDVFVIVGNNGSYFAMTNDNGTGGAPTAVAVSINDTKKWMTSDVASNMKWNISGNATDGYTFYPAGDTESWLYCTNTNNGVRVGTNDNKTFKVVGDYLQNVATSRYMGVYNSEDWRCYTSNGGNIADQTFTFYKAVDATYTRSVTADKWGTLCLPYDATVEGATLYTFEGVDDTGAPTTAYFEEAASVEAGKPYFFKATGTTLTATYTSGAAKAAASLNGAVGTLEDMDVDEGKYLLSNNELVKCGTGCTLAANRVYIDMSAASVYSGGGAVKMGVDLTDGISVVDAQSANATAFDLSGRRVVKPTKGLYIVNGKKVVIK